MMPPRGAAARGDQSATLETITHERLTATRSSAGCSTRSSRGRPSRTPTPTTCAWSASCAATSRRRCASRRALAAEASRAAALGQAAWQEARAAADFSRFRDALARQLELRHRYVACFEGFEHPYDVLLDDFEPGDDDRAGCGRCSPSSSRGSSRSSTAAADDAPPPDGGPFGGPYAVEDQRARGDGHPRGRRLRPRRLAARRRAAPVRAAHRAGRRPHHHPLRPARLHRRLLRRRCTSSATGSTRTDPGAARPQPARRPVSLGVHESQSRLWENLVGRSRPFCAWALPRLAAHLPGRLDGMTRRRALPRRQRRAPQPHPRRGRRDDLQPPHRPALRARARADRGHALRRRPAARVERGHAPAARPRRARRRAGRAPGRPLGRRADRLLPDVHARAT